MVPAATSLAPGGDPTALLQSLRVRLLAADVAAVCGVPAEGDYGAGAEMDGGGVVMKPYFDDGQIAIYHGDCREIVPTLGKFDLLLTDPPYGLGRKLQGGGWGKKYDGESRDWDACAPDMCQFLTVAAASIVWGGNYFHFRPSRCWLAWIKRDAVATMASVDFAWTTYDAPAKFFDWPIAASNKDRNGHPTMKPLALMTWCIRLAGNVKTILDPFAGSCTTGRAAKDMGRKCVCIEREEKYCEIGAKRMSQQIMDFGE